MPVKAQWLRDGDLIVPYSGASASDSHRLPKAPPASGRSRWLRSRLRHPKATAVVGGCKPNTSVRRHHPSARRHRTSVRCHRVRGCTLPRCPDALSRVPKRSVPLPHASSNGLACSLLPRTIATFKPARTLLASNPSPRRTRLNIRLFLPGEHGQSGERESQRRQHAHHRDDHPRAPRVLKRMDAPKQPRPGEDREQARNPTNATTDQTLHRGPPILNNLDRRTTVARSRLATSERPAVNHWHFACQEKPPLPSTRPTGLNHRSRDSSCTIVVHERARM